MVSRRDPDKERKTIAHLTARGLNQARGAYTENAVTIQRPCADVKRLIKPRLRKNAVDGDDT